ncbi:SCO family protein [Pontibacter sp. Tf4]|uniref:SCO family protein n=1 Tax=Pontibacter sp. Tf4 TaxID=2761620 RepID=UPI001626E161|nr:SCO family protein [Pontibacter sp. Tf4]MBB6612182.1 SCO family protein [Pontibacter sp. Tf4]
MTKLKALIVGILLLVPLFVFIFIYIFGEHYFTLKSYFPVRDESGSVVYTAEGDTLFRKVPDFKLTDQQGKPFSQQNLQGKIYVVNFVMADGPGIWHKLSSQLVRVQEAFQNNPDVALVSISVKPEEDTPQKLQQYATSFKADTSKWHFLTGDRNTIYQLAQQGFDIPLQKTGGPEDFLHTNQIMLVDKENVVRGVYDGTDLTDVDRLILEINVLIDEYSKRK